MVVARLHEQWKLSKLTPKLRADVEEVQERRFEIREDSQLWPVVEECQTKSFESLTGVKKASLWTAVHNRRLG